METNERSTFKSDSSEHDDPRVTRYRALASHLGAEADRVSAELSQTRAELDAAEEALREERLRSIQGRIAAGVSERDRQLAELELQRARTHITRTQPVLRAMRSMLQIVQESKFWHARNAWFSVKQRARLNATGPMPVWVPEVDRTADAWERDPPYERWLLAHQVRPGDVQRMRELLPILPLRPVFSILMPVYDTRERYLREAIESVIGQAYPDWELCIADDASQAAQVRDILEEYAAYDSRILVTYRAENGHISAASNSALQIANGDFVALLDHDDLLSPDALFEAAIVVNRQPDVGIIYSDEDKIDDCGRRSEPYFKPDWSPDSLLSRNYVSHLGIYRRVLLNEIGGFRIGYEGSQDYDLMLRASERAGIIEHIPRVLYHWRIHPDSTAAKRAQKGYAYDAAVRALSDALERRGETGRVLEDDEVPGIYTVRYAIRGDDLVSIIIPTRDHGDDVERCLRSLFDRSTYPNIEVILLDNGTTEPESLRTLGEWSAREPQRIKLVTYDVPFNFSQINNHAARFAVGEYLLFLNNDTEVITPDWIEAMVEQAQRPSIGAVGAKLLYEDGTVQHAGVVIGLGGVAGHSHKYAAGDEPGYFGTVQTVTNFSAVTGACLMLRRELFEAMHGFDERLAIAFNDVDLCLRIQAAGYHNIYLPHVELYHYESKSRGLEDTPVKMERFLREQLFMHDRWKTSLVPDPHYNLNLTLQTEDYAIGI